MRLSVVQLIHTDLQQNRPFWGTEHKQPRIPLTKNIRRLPSNSSGFSCAYTAMCLQCTGSLRRALQIVYVWTKYSKLFGCKNQTMFGPFETTTYLWCCLASNDARRNTFYGPASTHWYLQYSTWKKIGTYYGRFGRDFHSFPALHSPFKKRMCFCLFLHFRLL